MFCCKILILLQQKSIVLKNGIQWHFPACCYATLCWEFWWCRSHLMFWVSQFVSDCLLPSSLSSSIFYLSLLVLWYQIPVIISDTGDIERHTSLQGGAGWLSVLLNFSLIHRCDDMRVQACGCTLLLIPHGIITSLHRLWTSLFHSVSLAQQTHYARQ